MFSSALLLFGLSLIYGTTGSLYFEDIPAALDGSALQIMALVFFFSGMGFKISLVPFHLWTADVYEGSPSTVTAYLSVISKGSGRPFSTGLSSSPSPWPTSSPCASRT